MAQPQARGQKKFLYLHLMAAFFFCNPRSCNIETRAKMLIASRSAHHFFSPLSLSHSRIHCKRFKGHLPLAHFVLVLFLDPPRVAWNCCRRFCTFLQTPLVNFFLICRHPADQRPFYVAKNFHSLRCTLWCDTIVFEATRHPSSHFFLPTYGGCYLYFSPKALF